MPSLEILAGALVMVAACLAQTHPPAGSAALHQRGAAQKSVPALPDRQVEAAIRARFARSKIAADGFQVRVQGGVATIEGRTDVVQHKGVATRLAKSAGALAVNNRVQPSQAARQKSAANLAKGRRRAQIKRGEARSAADQPRQGR
jgi:hypothetical protein